MLCDDCAAATTQPTCDYCGWLGWTVEKYGRVTHKQGCPHRVDPWHQGDPHPEERPAASLHERLRAHADLLGVYTDTDAVVADLRAAADVIERGQVWRNAPPPMGSAGICGAHGAYVGRSCPKCVTQVRHA